MKNWTIDPKTGDYVMNGGSPIETSSLQVPAYIRLKTRRSNWLYAPDSDYGSDYYLLRKRQGVLDASTVETIGERALQPIVDDGRASEITVQTSQTARHGIAMETKIVDAKGEPEEITFVGLGV